MTTLEQWCDQALCREPSLPAIEFEGHWYDWGDMRRLAERVDALMAATGAPPHAPVAFVARNRPSAAAALLALIRQSRLIQMVYAFQSPASIARNLDKSNPAVVLVMAEDASDELLAVLRDRKLAGIVLDKMDARPWLGCEFAATRVPGTPEAQREIHILTSGTTGPPKQFALTYDLIARHMVGENQFMAPQPDDADRGAPPYFAFPIGNVTGIYSMVPALLFGAPFVLADRFNLREWHDYVLRHRPVFISVPPPAVQMLLDADIPPEDLASARFMSTGAAPLDPAVHRAFEERYGIPVLLSYGATEFAGPAVLMTPDLHREWGERKFGSLGRPLPGIQLRVIDPESDAVLPPGREGLLEVVVPRIGQHWIRTSDLAIVDEDGFLFHRGRADGAIMNGGFKILPETIETALLLHPAIAAAGVVGVPNRRLGQVPAAVIELRPGATRPSEAELQRHIRDNLLATHVPAFWHFVEELPKNPSFKIDRQALGAFFRALS